MMRSIGVILFACLLPFIAQPQSSEGDSTLVFKVRNPQVEVKIVPEDTVLWTGQKNIIKVRITPGHKIGSVTLDNGTIRGNDTSYTAIVKNGKTAMLSVYERMPDNTLRLCASKLYWIQKNPDPVVNVCGITADSVADKQDLILKNKVIAVWEQKNLILPVLGFRMISLNKNGNSDTLVSYSEQFTIDMRNRIHDIPDGSVLTFDEVICLMPSGKMKKLGPIQIFVAKTNKYNVGKREF
jgi:hypothetical protein